MTYLVACARTGSDIKVDDRLLGQSIMKVLGLDRHKAFQRVTMHLRIVSLIRVVSPVQCYSRSVQDSRMLLAQQSITEVVVRSNQPLLSLWACH